MIIIIPITIFINIELFDSDVSPKTNPSLFPKELEKEKYNTIIKNTINIITGLKIKLLNSLFVFINE